MTGDVVAMPIFDEKYAWPFTSKILFIVEVELVPMSTTSEVLSGYTLPEDVAKIPSEPPPPIVWSTPHDGRPA